MAHENPVPVIRSSDGELVHPDAAALGPPVVATPVLPGELRVCGECCEAIVAAGAGERVAAPREISLGYRCECCEAIRRSPTLAASNVILPFWAHAEIFDVAAAAAAPVLERQYARLSAEGDAGELARLAVTVLIEEKDYTDAGIATAVDIARRVLCFVKGKNR